MRVNSGKLIDRYFGEMKKIRAFLRSYSVEPLPSDDVLQKWKTRGVPAEWVLILLVLLEVESGSPVSLAPYMEGQ